MTEQAAGRALTPLRALSRVGVLLGLAVLVCSVSLAMIGCGVDDAPLGSASEPMVSVTTTSTGARASEEAQRAAAVHERVMAEHRRRMTAALATPTADGISAQSSGSQSQLSGTGSPDANVSASPAAQAGTTAAVLTGGRTPLTGIWSGTAEQLAAYLLSENPQPLFTVPPLVLAEQYIRYGAEAGLRADLLWAQMLHETGYGMYGGDVSPEQNNYAGIGATGGGAAGVYFLTAEAGVLAHVAHMVAYVYQSSSVPWANAYTDPRFDAVYPRGTAAVLADLNGRWAVPGTYYGQAVEEVARAINQR